MPYRLVARVLAEDPAGIMAGVGRVDGDEIITELTAHLPHTHVAVGAAAAIAVGEVEEVAGPIPSLRIPLRFRGVHGTHLFPVMEASLEAFAATPDETELAIAGEYSPPLGAVGALVDHALMHRVAESSVAELLEVIVHEIKNRRRMHELDRAPSPDG